MAFVLDDERQSDQPVQVSDAAPGGAGSPSAESTGAAPASPVSHGFVGFDRYFGANAGAAAGVANSIAGQVTKQAEDAKASANDAYSGFAQQVQKAGDAAPAAPTRSEDGSTYSSSPASYSGPTSFTGSTDAGALTQKLTDASSALNQTKDAAGLQTFLDGRYNTNASYNNAQQRFDAALAGRAGEGQFAQLRNYFGDLTGQMDTLEARGNQAVTDAKARIDTANKGGVEKAAQMTRELEEQRQKAEAEEVRRTQRYEGNPHVRRAQEDENGRPRFSGFDSYFGA